jgi:hypothetical protein
MDLNAKPSIMDRAPLCANLIADFLRGGAVAPGD